MLTLSEITVIPCGPIAANACLVCPQGRQDCFLVDPGDDLALLHRHLKASGRRLAAILLTHGHFDHLLSAQPLSEETSAPVYLHPGDEEMLTDPDKMAWNPEYCIQAPPANLQTRPYPEGEFEVCGVGLKALPTPGHSRGSVCLYAQDGGILFSGDTLFQRGFGRTDLYGGSEEALFQSLRALLTGLPEDTRVLPGHGAGTTIGRERQVYGL